MRIEIVQLENIRSHTKSTVPFTSGFNCLVGGLGCGKSSVLYAVDFALFGDAVGRSFEYLLREGAESCKVTVVFSQNGNTYKIIRGLKRRGKGISQDFDDLKLFEEDKLIASQKNEAIAEQIKMITGLNKDLYREIVWFRQEHLKELLDAPPRDRQRRLDELFGLSDYEAAWSNIAQYQRDYETEKRVLEKDPDVNSLEKISGEYSKASEEYAYLEIELEGAAQKLALAKKSLDAADVKLRMLEQKKLALEELKRKETRLHANLTNIKSAFARATQNIQDKKTVIDNLQSRQTSFENQTKQCIVKLEQAGLSAVQLENLGECLSEFDEKIGNLKAEHEATQRSMQQDQKRTIELAKESKCPLCIQPLDGEYKTDLLNRIEYENSERTKLLAQLKIDIAGLQKNKLLVAEAIGNLQTASTRASDLKVRLSEEEVSLKKLVGDLEEQQRLQLETQLQHEQAVAEIVRFDLSELSAAKEQRENAFKQFYATQSELRTKENRKKDLFARLDDIRERINVAQEKLERVEKIRRTIEILSAIRDSYRSIQPKLRSEFIKVLRNFVQQVLDSLVGGETALLNITIDETYTPYVKSESGTNREVSNLSGGERTLLAFAYRLGLGQLIMQSRTGHGLGMLLLDEPTENLGSEDGSIEHLAEAISKFKAIEQIIAVTHSEAFASKAEHAINLEKEDGVSKISIQR
ncbi:MAG: SMC family ATPase [Candidatus Bathyarchaeota archaeon]|nr:SMC family ATPase [Candidatus Bathyarchaeota archaeon]